MAYPTLNANELNNALFNQIISRQIISRIHKGSALVDKARVDGTLFGDTKLYFAADAIPTKPFVQDSADALNLLAVSRNKSVRTQAIKLDVFRYAETTTDTLMTARAWSEEGSLAQYNDLLNSMIPNALYIYDTTTYDTFIGNVVSAVGKQSPAGLSLTEGKEGQEIAKFMADLIVDMTHPSRKYNDYGHLTKFSQDQLVVVWNSRWVSYIEKINMPVTFHKDFMDKFAENIVYEDYFGRAVAADDCGSGKVIKANGEYDATKGVICSKVEKTFTFEGNEVHIIAGQPLEAGMKIAYTGGSVANPDFEEGEVYIKDDNVICKVFTKLPPYMSACELSSEFVNVKNHSTNRYLVFGRNELAKFDAHACVTVKKAAA